MDPRHEAEDNSYIVRGCCLLAQLGGAVQAPYYIA